MRSGTHISFYLRGGTIHIHRSTIRALDNPQFVRFLISDDGTTLLVQSYYKKDFRSFRVPESTNDEIGRVQIHSKGLCGVFMKRFGWKEELSYRIPGKPFPTQGVAAFDLTRAEVIHGWWQDAKRM